MTAPVSPAAEAEPRGRQSRRSEPGIYPFKCRKDKTTHYKWYVTVDGRQEWHTSHEPLRVVQDLRRERLKAVKGLKPGGIKTVGDVVKAYIDGCEQRIEDPSIVGYKRSWTLLEKRLDKVVVADASPDLIQGVLLDLYRNGRDGRGYSTSVIYHARNLLGSAFADALAKRKIPFTPFAPRSIRLPALENAEPHFFTAAQLGVAWDALDGDPLGRLILACGGFMGMRIGEMAAIGAADLTESHALSSRGRVRFDVADITRAMGTRKGSQYLKGPKSKAGVRRIPIPSKVRPFVSQLDPADESGFLATIPADIKSRRNYLQIRWAKRAAKLVSLGLPRVTPHGLRHSYVTLLADAGVHEIVAKRITGHKYKDVTGRYTHPTGEQLYHALEQIEAYLSRPWADLPQAVSSA